MPSTTRDNKTPAPLIAFLAAYATCLLLLLPHLSLWLDEVLNVIGARKATFSDLFDFVAHNAGSVPLGYLVQRFSISLLGVSEFSARLPSVVSSLVGAFGMLALARRLGARIPAASVVLFCLLPLQWRYAMEGRPYEMALALSIWSTVLLLDLLRDPRFLSACLYSLVVAGGLYTNPYSLFVPAAHVLWLFSRRFRSSVPSRVLPLALVANAFAVVLFLPWYLYARHAWATTVPAIGHTSALKIVELITKDLVGAGYIGTFLILLMAAVGCKKLSAGVQDTTSLLILWVVVPIALVLTGNALFHYFLAVRQMIFVLPPLCLLAGFGVDASKIQNGKAAILVFSCLLGICLFDDVNLFFKPREDWRAAAFALRNLSSPETCMIYVPPDSVNLYRVFDQTLSDDKCHLSLPDHYLRIVLATSPYAPPGSIESAAQSIPLSFHQARLLIPAGPTIAIYERK